MAPEDGSENVGELKERFDERSDSDSSDDI